MAFNFYGTFSTAQWDDLVNFARIQAGDIEDRIKYLDGETLRVGKFITEYDADGIRPVLFTVTPHFSYAAKLLQAYKILGGVPEHDMLLRTSDKPVFLTRGQNISKDSGRVASGYSDVFSNGRRMRGNQRFDRDLGIRIERFKNWQLEAIKHKRENLEMKIKRALDHSDQLQIEATLLRGMLAEDSLQSVEEQITNINLLMFRPGAKNVIRNPNDFWGLNIGRIGDDMIDEDREVADAEALRL